MAYIGFDTSNYTTSVAAFFPQEGRVIQNKLLLPVKKGEKGLRQSDAVFHHTVQLGPVFQKLSEHEKFTVDGVCASVRPCLREDSYMPCFLAGSSTAEVMSRALNVPFFAFSHQQGHIAASLFSSGHMELMDKPHLAWHLSGGTTELLYVTPEGVSVHAEKIGGTTDISAGQLIDRTGRLQGLPFPAGKALDALSAEADNDDFFRVKVNGMEFSLSGVQNKVEQYRGAPAETARFALQTLIDAIVRATENAQKEYPNCPVVFAGGVASNSMLRQQCAALPAIFCPPQYATDNALGVAVLTWRACNAANGL